MLFRSPAALVDGTLGNRVTITRTNPATGVEASESAIVRTRADGGLVLQTGEGFEAVRCAGIPEKLTFDRIPAGLSAQPVFSIDTRDFAGGTYTVELTYLAWGFDWQAHYVATLDGPGRGDVVDLKLMSWLTLLNDNGQSFPDAELLVVAGRLNVVSDFEGLADPPSARGLHLTCYPIGSTAAGSAEVAQMVYSAPPAPAPPPMMAMAREAQDIVVTGGRIASKAQEEALGDLKLYRVPDRVTVAAQSLKQVAFLDQDEVKGRLLYKISCMPGDEQDTPMPASILLATVNDKRHGLGMALPMGGVTVFGPSAFGDQLLAEDRVRDYAEGQDVELGLGESSQVFAQCRRPGTEGGEGDDRANEARWRAMRTTVSNANAEPITVRVTLGSPVDLQVRGFKRTQVKGGVRTAEITIPGNTRRAVTWEVRAASNLASK